MDEKEIREKAIRKYKNGKSPKEIYQSLGKGKTWFFKWLKRYKHDGENWAESRSRKPHLSPKKIHKDMEQTVIETRKRLEKQLYAQIGAMAISFDLVRQGIHPPPFSTINNILKRNNLVRKRLKYTPKGVDYPSLEIIQSNYLHQFDVLGPRYLKTDGRFYSANIIDAYDRRTSVNPMRRQTRIDISQALIRSWQTLGIPAYLQLDNKLPMRGSNRYPHSFGLVIRLSLLLGIQPIFIPIKEPWRNGIIERFQNVFDKMFFRAQYFESFSYLVQQARGFETFHNQNHRYSTMKGKTPLEKVSGELKYLPNNFRLPKKLSIVPGYIHLIRFIRSNRILDIFGEKLSMPMEVEYEYVWATIDTAKGKLFVCHDSELVDEYSYPLPKTFIDVSKIDL
jgi:putative transposase